MDISPATNRFGELIRSELERIELMKSDVAFTDFKALDQIVIGILPGDGIGPIIIKQALRVLKSLMNSEINSGRVILREIEGMTIENRAAAGESMPEYCFTEIKKCDVILKGPMVTPRATDPWPNLISANTLLRRRLDLFAAVRPIRIKDKGIDWTFFRENIEGEYIFGNKGIQVNEDLAIDFKVETKQGSERIARAAFEFARINGKKSVAAVTKANIVKLTDGNFAKMVHKVGEEYPGIRVEERLVDAMAAKMLDPEFNEGLEVIVLQNLYGDIITDIAAELQGGLGSAASSNLGSKYAMFEAIHGTAPYLVEHDRAEYANPCSIFRAVGMLLSHIGYPELRTKLEDALDICTETEQRIVITSLKEDASTEEFTDYLLEVLAR